MPSEAYPRSNEILSTLLGLEVEKIRKYLHAYTGTGISVKPIAKNITIYWVGRLGAEAIIRTENEEDIILTKIAGEALPTLIFRKFKAAILRAYMEDLRRLWVIHKDTVLEVLKEKYGGIYGEDYDFFSCGISPGIEAGEERSREKSSSGKTVMELRCMKCPVDVLMGAVSGKIDYNLASRLLGDPAYATSPNFNLRTGNAVEEVLHITGMEARKAKGTGALYKEYVVNPGTIFIGKTVLFMPSPPELVYMLKLLFTRIHRFGARRTIMGTMEIKPVALIAGPFEVGTAYSATEYTITSKNADKDNIEYVKSKVMEYVKRVTDNESTLVWLTEDTVKQLVKINLEKEEELYKELWINTANFVAGVHDYITMSRERGKR